MEPKAQEARARFVASGFTLIELLVVVFIIGLLVALLLPAVQSARESARRFQCVSNLRSMGIAIQGYSSQTGVFPRGEMAFSIQTAILPFIEQTDLYNSINCSRYYPDDIALTANQTAEATTIGTYLCPSDSYRQTRPGPSNYGGNWGVGLARSGALNNGPFAAYNPTFDNIPPVGFRDIIDGSSQTAGMAEFCRGDSLARHVSQVVLRTNSAMNGINRFDQFTSACLSTKLSQATVLEVWKGKRWMPNELGQTLYNHAMPPNTQSCENTHALTAEGAWTAGSQHPGGVHVLFLDGHVAFKTSSIALNVWRALGTMNNREVIAEE